MTQLFGKFNPTNISKYLKLFSRFNLKIINNFFIFRYTCNNPTKLIVDLTNISAPLADYINTTCLVNGDYSIDITNFGCIGITFDF